MFQKDVYGTNGINIIDHVQSTALYWPGTINLYYCLLALHKYVQIDICAVKFSYYIVRLIFIIIFVFLYSFA